MRAKTFGQTTMAETAYLTKRVLIRAMHSLGNQVFSDDKNREIFGKCFRLHGHHYFCEVTVRGAIDKSHGLICDRDKFERKLQKEFILKFDKTNLNDQFKNTSGEALAKEFYELLKTKMKPLDLVMIRLQETPKNFFIYGDPTFLKMAL